MKLIKLQILQELTSLVKHKKLLTPRLWSKESKYQVLFENIMEIDITPTKLAIICGYKTAEDFSFIKLCSRYEDKISDLVLVIDLGSEGRTDIAKGANRAVKDYLKGYELLSRTMRKSANYFFDKAYHQANKYTLTELRYLTVSSKLRYMAVAALFGKEYDKLRIELETIRQIESQELRMYELVATINQMTTQKAVRVSKAELIALYNEVDQITESTFSYRLTMSALNVKTTVDRFLERYHLIIANSEAVQKLLKSKGLASTTSIFLTTYFSTGALIAMHKFEAAILSLAKQKKVIKSSPLRLFTVNNDLFTCFIHTNQFLNSWHITQEVVKNKKHAIAYPRFAEGWKIKRAYLQLFFEVYADDEKSKKSIVPKLTSHNLRKLLNDIQVADKDKAGGKTSAIILELVFAVVKKDYDILFERHDAVKQHSYRHLRGAETKRDKLFLDLLLNILKTNFNQRHITLHSKTTLAKLTKIPKKLTQSTIEHEVIPYEIMWDLLVKSFPR